MKWYYGTAANAKTTFIDVGYLGGINGLSVGEYEWETDASWSVPTTPGTYWLTSVIDSDNNNAESNEGNNEGSVRFYVDPPDLIAYNVTVSDATVDPGQSITVNWTAKNQGSGSAGATEQGVMWSADSTIARNDTLLEKEYLGTMGASVTSPEAHTITIPANATPGQTYYIGIYADYDLEINEGNFEGNNNSAGVAVTINLPDLRITSMQMAGNAAVDQHFSPGQSIRLDFQGYNGGTGRSKSSVQMKWYYGTAANAKTTYIDVGYLGEINGLSAGEYEWETDASWSVPTTPGTYWLTSVIDSDNNNAESNEGNNEGSVRFYVDPPDLIAYNVTLSDATVDPGQSITVNWTAKNQGSGSAGATQQGVMWSADSTIARNDTLLEKEYLGTMGANVTSPEAHTITIPANATPGQTYYIGIYADYDLEINEGNFEGNNNSAGVAVTINSPDLRITSMQMAGNAAVDQHFSSGQRITLDFQGYNKGTGKSKSSVQMKWYYGTATNAKTTYIGVGYLGKINGLSVGEYEWETDASWIVPTTPGTYWLTSVIDSDNNNDESNEGNNERSVRFYVDPPDLIAYNVTVSDATVDPGQSITVNWTAKNQGSGSAGATQQGVMWSGDSTIARNDTLLEKEYLGTMGASVTSPEAHTITIPANATPGQTYYIGIYADYDLEVNEGSLEGNNNSAAVAVTVNARILSAYWWMPLDVSHGDVVTMCAEVKGMPVGSKCTFQIIQDDGILQPDDPVSPTIMGSVYTAEDGKTYVKGSWVAQWISDQSGDPEFYFKVTYGDVSLKSSRSDNEELHVRNNRQQPSSAKGDFYYDPGTAVGEATKKATLTDDRIPIILLHGMSGDKKIDSLNYWYGWANADTAPVGSQLGLFNQTAMKYKFRVYRYVYDSRRPIADNGAAFAGFVNQFYRNNPALSERQVLIMAHSMGGLVARYALNTDSAFREKVHRLITLGTPHLGSPGANPTWVYWDNVVNAANPSVNPLKDYQALIHAFTFGGDEGAFNLGWYNISEIPAAARTSPALFLAHQLYPDSLVNGSLTSPFCGSSAMLSEDEDSKIVAYGGYFSLPIDGAGDNWPDAVKEELISHGITDHTGLWAAKEIMGSMTMQSGTAVGSNDGLVPAASTLLGASHTTAEKINLKEMQPSEAVDHVSYLDVASTMDYVVKRLSTAVKVTLSPQGAIDGGARWRMAGGAWQKSGVSLNALKAGQYTIEFKDIAGWTTRGNQTVTVYANATTALNAGAYCGYSLSADEWSAPAGGDSINIAVTALGGGCSWTASSPCPWVGLSTSGGSASETIIVTAQANTTGSARTCNLTIAGKNFAVTQPACGYSISMSSWTAPAGGGNTTVNVTTTGGCPWNTSSPCPWVNVSTVTRSGSASVAIAAEANTGCDSRSCTLTIAGQNFIVSQAAAPISISAGSWNAPAGGGITSVSVTAPSGCGWSATSPYPWMSVATGGGVGSGLVSVTAEVNTTGNSRNCALTIAGRSFAVTQAACGYAISPTNANFPATATNGSFRVTGSGGCPWTAFSNVGWITVTSGDSGTGNGTVNFTVAANPNVGSRAGTITAAGQTFAINQTGDTTRPTNNIASPLSGERWSNSVFVIKGTAKDNLEVASVLCKLNGEEWTPATSTNGWTNWTAIATLVPGTNRVQVLAVDTAGNVSLTNSVNFTYVVSGTLAVRTVGQGTLTPNYSNAVLEIGRSYSMTASGANGHVFSNWNLSTNWSEGEDVTTPKLDFIMQTGLTLQAEFADVARPQVTITSPLTGQRVSNAVITVRGQATDNAHLAQVLCQINNSDWLTAAGTTDWTASLLLAPGTNRVRVFAVDAAGSMSQTNTVTFIYVATSQLTLLTNGLGRISLSFTGNTLEVGKGYTVTAVPLSGQLFSNWVGTVTATNNPLKFVMQPDMVLQANFVPTPYPALKGSYAGLFMPSSTEAVSGTNAGSVTLTLTERGTFSGSFRLAGGTLPFTGRFDVGRLSTVKVSRVGKAPLWLNLGFDAQSITGQVTTTGWAADLSAVRRATASSNALAGRYSMLAMGQHENTDAPPGDCALAVTVSAPSAVTVSGTMADGSAVSLATGHSVEGRWPFYASLHGRRGLVIGWMSCAANPGNQEVLWVKPPDSAARYYPAGFREEREVALQRYLPPAPKQTATSWTLGRLLVGGGNLPTPLAADVLVTNNIIKSLEGTVSNLSVRITNSNGRFGGSFLNPVTRKTTSVRGVLVQGLPWASPAEQVPVGGGWFLGTNAGGYIWLEPRR